MADASQKQGKGGTHYKTRDRCVPRFMCPYSPQSINRTSTTMSAFGIASVVLVVYSLILRRVNEVVSVPYMDEIFHVPQAQTYCAGRYMEWDPKITTFPGVYVTGVALARLVQLTPLVPDKAFCSIDVLRFVNVLFAVGNAWLIVHLRSALVPTDKHAVMHALMVLSFPVLFFFSFLFYTDAGATFFVLLMYTLATHVDLRVRPVAITSFLPSAIAGATAVLFRQTNIVWVVFVAGILVVRFVEISQGQRIYGSSKQDAKLHPTTLVVRNSAIEILVNFVVAVVTELPALVRILWPFVAVVVAFLAFLLHNGGIVVGDKSNHEAGFHGAQVLYFIFVASTGFGAGLFSPTQVLRFADTIRRKAKSLSGLLFLVVTLATVLLVIHLFSPVHKFMLADNRHYTFYVWRKFFLKHRFAKFIPTLLYVFQAWRYYSQLRRTQTPLWLLVFSIATILVLVPSPLVEPRYYLIPFVLVHLHTPPQPAWQLGSTITAFTLVNAATLYVFLYRSYTWVDGTTGRFMW